MSGHVVYYIGGPKDLTKEQHSDAGPPRTVIFREAMPRPVPYGSAYRSVKFDEVTDHLYRTIAIPDDLGRTFVAIYEGIDH